MTEQEEIASIMQEHGCSMGAASYILLQQRNDALVVRLAEAEALLREIREDAPHFGMRTTRIDALLAPDSASGEAYVQRKMAEAALHALKPIREGSPAECRHDWFRLLHWPAGRRRCYVCGVWQEPLPADQPPGVAIRESPLLRDEQVVMTAHADEYLDGLMNKLSK